MKALAALAVLLLAGCSGTVTRPGPNTFLSTTVSNVGDEKTCTVNYASGAERQIGGLKGTFCGNDFALTSSASENSEAVAAQAAADAARMQLISTLAGRVVTMAGAALAGGASPDVIAEALDDAGDAIEGSVPAPEPEVPSDDDVPELPSRRSALPGPPRPAPQFYELPALPSLPAMLIAAEPEFEPRLEFVRWGGGR
jgi:hypothetical protein